MDFKISVYTSLVMLIFEYKMSIMFAFTSKSLQSIYYPGKDSRGVMLIPGYNMAILFAFAVNNYLENS
jgi:hypothetical protein